MPLYEYKCSRCNKTFELLRRLKDADEPAECPNCGSDTLDRLLSTFAAGGCGASGSRGFT